MHRAQFRCTRRIDYVISPRRGHDASCPYEYEISDIKNNKKTEAQPRSLLTVFLSSTDMEMRSLMNEVNI